MANILFINDDPKTIHTLKEHLIKEGHQVTVANHATDGIQNAVTTKPDVIFVDPLLTGVTGSQICSKLRKNAVTKRTPIIMLDEKGRHPHVEKFARAMGVTEFVKKPLKVIELGEMVGRYVQVKTHEEEMIQAILYINRARPASDDASQEEPEQKKSA